MTRVAQSARRSDLLTDIYRENKLKNERVTTKVREAETKTSLPHTEVSPFVLTVSEVLHLTNIYAQKHTNSHIKTVKV